MSKKYKTIVISIEFDIKHYERIKNEVYGCVEVCKKDAAPVPFFLKKMELDFREADGKGKDYFVDSLIGIENE